MRKLLLLVAGGRAARYDFVMERISIGNALRRGALALFLASICQPTWASHWFMTGVVENGTRVAGLDRDSIVREAEGLRKVTLVSFQLARSVTITATGDLDVDCAKQQFQQLKVTIIHADGRRATILSRGPDWDKPTNPIDATLIEAACTENFATLVDIHDTSPARYVADMISGSQR